MIKNNALRLSGAVAIAVAIYHGVSGDAILSALDINPADQMAFVRSTHQIGTTGWIAGGLLLFAAGNFKSQQARNWIVGVFTKVYGIPAFGLVALTGGNPGIGGIGLVTILILAHIGRKITPSSTATHTTLGAAL